MEHTFYVDRLGHVENTLKHQKSLQVLHPSMITGASPAKMAVAMFPYQGEQSSDLSFNANDKITVLKEVLD